MHILREINKLLFPSDRCQSEKQPGDDVTRGINNRK